MSGYDVNIGGTTKSTDYIYGELTKAPDIITGVKQNGTRILTYGYDALNRLDTRTISTTTPFVTEYEYQEGATSGTTTTFVESVKNGNDTLTYTYDNMGNITSVSKNGTLIESYTYDYLNQLKTVTRGSDTYEYIYDNGGNILSVKRNGEVIKTYTYGDTEWKDLLTAYNGETITYDTIGNPLTYRGGINFTWTDGRKLSGITKGTDSISYTYDSNGLRNSKTVNGTTTEYYWLNGMLQGQKTGNEFILFLHDESGSVYGFILKNDAGESYYYYEFNLQGDIIGIIDSTGNKVVEYTYDEWGKLLSTTGTLADTIGQKNPLRYRGYYYDAETGFYYVSSRYYDPEIGRFINADKAIAGVGGTVNGYNLYSYCFNNPVNLSDPTGDWPKWISTIGNTVKKAVNSVVKAVKKAANTVKATVVKFANKTSNASNKRPPTGDPGSTYVAPNGDSRTYGPDGKPVHDYDHSDHGNPKNHPHDENGGHHHDWDWTKNPPRQGPYIPNIEQIIGVGLVTISSVGIAAVAIDDFTGIGIADNFLYGPLGAGVSQGLIMIY